MDVVLFQKIFEKINNGSIAYHYFRWEQAPTHASTEANHAHLQAPHQLPKRQLPRQLSELRVDLNSPDYRLWDAGTIPTSRRTNCSLQEAETRLSTCHYRDTKGEHQKAWSPWQPHEASTCKQPGLPQDLVPKTFTKIEKVPDIH